MDAFHKMLVRLYEETGGKENIDVDFVDLTKKEGYYPSIDSIVSHLKSESWITESRPNIVRITHWGVAEARKVGTGRPDAARVVERESRRMLTETRETAVLIEEFAAAPSAERFTAVEEKVAELTRLTKAIREAL
ncbi:MAG: hypothetical protein KF736_07925 [Acidobacteria bacterium]|nr:hypothetical protein [Acidobacteriota bacterium]MCW5948951.1 hypothetical protein [Pyrinomonadaceae bacterium]